MLKISNNDILTDCDTLLVGTGGIRSFDRTFMLVPAPDNSRYVYSILIIFDVSSPLSCKKFLARS